jgi:UDP-glucuronate 4-epimerase
MSSIVVTGAAGFIGEKISSRLLSLGHKVYGIDILSDLLYPSKIKRSRIKKLASNPNFVFVESKLSDCRVDKVLSEVEIVINLAALPGQVLSWERASEYVSANATEVIALLIKMLNQQKPMRFIQASTSSVYGESAWGDETQSLNPTSPYGVSKLAAEQAIRQLTNNSLVEFIVFRFFSVYGPDQRPDMAISKFMTKIQKSEPIVVYGSGKQLRDLTFVDDIVDGTIKGIDRAISGDIFNLASGRPLELNQVIDLLFEITGREVPIIHQPRQIGDQMRTFGDCKKALEELDWQPKTPLEIGLKSQWDFHQQERFLDEEE